MKKNIIKAILLVLLPLSVFACSKGSSNNLLEENMEQRQQQEIQAFVNAHLKAMLEKDIVALDSLLADDLILVHITGATQTKSEWLAEIQNETMRYYSGEIQNLKITITGNRAVATYTSVLDARIWGSRNVWRLNSTMHLEKRGNRWIRVNPI